MSSFEPLLHPHTILDFLVKQRLPDLASQCPLVGHYYKQILAEPEAAIMKCRFLLSTWVVDMFEAGTLLDAEALKEYEMPLEGIPAIPGVYLWVIVLADGHRFYGGQTNNLRYRIVHSHSSAKHRARVTSLAYTFIEDAVEKKLVLPVVDPDLTDGPIKNLLEQWLVVIFRALQPKELEENLPKDAFEKIPSEHLTLGANLAEPFAQGLPLTAFPGRTGKRGFGMSLEVSDDPAKRRYAASRKAEQIEHTRKRDVFLQGHPFLPPPLLPNGQFPTSEWTHTIEGVTQQTAVEATSAIGSEIPTPAGVGRFVRWQWGHNDSDY